MYKYDFPMPKNYRGLLLDIVEISNREQSSTGQWYKKVAGITLYIGKNQSEFPEISGDPMLAFHALNLIGIVEKTEKLSTYVLKPDAFDWANYQNKKALGKWFERLPGQVKTLMLFISFILSVILAYFQIANYLSTK